MSFILAIGWTYKAYSDDVEVKILPEDQTCQVNQDCVFVYTDCLQGGCIKGKLVNKKNAQKYKDLYEQCTKDNAVQKLPTTTCEPVTKEQHERCMNSECVVFTKDIQGAPVLKMAQVRSLARRVAADQSYDFNDFKDPQIEYDPAQKEWDVFFIQKCKTQCIDVGRFVVSVNDRSKETRLKVVSPIVNDKKIQPVQEQPSEMSFPSGQNQQQDNRSEENSIIQMEGNSLVPGE